jgi:hypothetical protein
VSGAISVTVLQQPVTVTPSASGWQVTLGLPGTDRSFVYNQLAPASTWAITHNLGKYPSVSVVDSGGNWVVGDVIYLDANSLTVRFSAAFGGTAYLN